MSETTKLICDWVGLIIKREVIKDYARNTGTQTTTNVPHTHIYFSEVKIS